MHETFDELDKKPILTEESKQVSEEEDTEILPRDSKQDSEEENTAILSGDSKQASEEENTAISTEENKSKKKIKVKHEVIATTTACTGDNIEIIQEMHERCDRIEHLTISGNGPLHIWPLELLYRLFKLELGEECIAFKYKRFPILLNEASIRYNDIIINVNKENITPEMIRELLKRCRRKEAFCRSKYPQITDKVCEAIIDEADQKWLEEFQKVAVIVHHGMEILISLQRKSMQIKNFNNNKLPNLTNDWIRIILESEEYVDYASAVVLFEKFAPTLKVLDTKQLKVKGKVDTFSLAADYFKESAHRLDSLLLFIMSIDHDSIDSYIAYNIKGKMQTLIESMDNIIVIALANTTEFDTQWTDYCPVGWASFDNTKVIGCYEKNRIVNIKLPIWIETAIYPNQSRVNTQKPIFSTVTDVS